MKRLLWVDDDYEMLRTLAEALSADGWRLQVAEDARVCLDVAAQSQFDIVLIDVNLKAGGISDTPDLAALAAAKGAHRGVILARLLLGTAWHEQLGNAALAFCSSFDRSHVQAFDPEILETIPYFSKAEAFLAPHDFVQALNQLLQSRSRQVESTDFPSASSLPSEQPQQLTTDADRFEERLHDLWNAVATTLAPLAALVSNFDNLAGRGTKSLIQIAVDYEQAANRVLEEATDFPLTDWDAWELAEAARGELKAQLGHFSPSQQSMLSHAIRKLAVHLAKMPKTRSYEEAITTRARFEFSRAKIEIDAIKKLVESSLQQNRSDMPADSEGPFDTSEVVNSLIEMFNLPAMSKRIAFRPQVLEGLVLNHGSRRMYWRCLSAVIENAVKFNGKLPDEETWIEVTHRLIGGSIVTEIESWGPEVMPEEEEAVFQRGRRGRNPRRLGSGLGLAIARDSIRACSGTVSIKSVEKRRRGQRDVQTTVMIAVPLAPSSRDAL